MKWRILIYLLALCLACGGFRFTTTSDEESLADFLRKAVESDIEPSRSTKSGRKASENKRPWLSDSFLDMEVGEITPPYDIGPWNFELPPLGSRPSTGYYPNDIYVVAGGGCILCGPNRVDCEKEYIVRFCILHGIVVKVTVDGPVAYWEQKGTTGVVKIVIQPYPNSTIGTKITVNAWTKALIKSDKPDGFCKHVAKIAYCGACECLGFTPDIDSSADTIAAGGSITLWVDSGGLACPPYNWSVSGNGCFHRRVRPRGLDAVCLG